MKAEILKALIAERDKLVRQLVVLSGQCEGIDLAIEIVRKVVGQAGRAKARATR